MGHIPIYILFVVIMFYLLMFFIGSLEKIFSFEFWKDNIQLIANTVTILGVISLWFSFYKHFDEKKKGKKKKLESELQAVQIMKHQLITTSWWTRYSEDGYNQDDETFLNQWRSDNFRERIKLLHKINSLEYSSLESASLLPGTRNLGDTTNSLIAGYKQWLKTFNDYLLEIKQFIYSRSAEKNITLAKKTSQAITNENLMKILTEEERNFVDILFKMYESLHFQIIGADKTQSLFHYHKRLLDEIQEHEKNLLKDLAKIS